VIALLITGCTCAMTFGGGMLALRMEASRSFVLAFAAGALVTTAFNQTTAGPCPGGPEAYPRTSHLPFIVMRRPFVENSVPLDLTRRIMRGS
jgi:hypothetical protein